MVPSEFHQWNLSVAFVSNAMNSLLAGVSYILNSRAKRYEFFDITLGFLRGSERAVRGITFICAAGRYTVVTRVVQRPLY